MMMIPFSMFLHCSSVPSSFFAFIFFLTSLFTFLYYSPAAVLVYFCCFSCHLWSYRSRTSFVTQSWVFFLCLPRTCSAVESSPSFRLFARVSILLTRTQRAANFPPALAWNTSAIFGSWSFSRSNWMWGLFMKHLVFNFKLMVLSMRSSSLLMLASGKNLVFALLTLGFKRWGVRMKSIWWVAFSLN